ncbi:MAG: DNA mismatch repair protein MutS [Bacteroidetes bacterium]|nr:DNA mismatch repair protein MutS [Bacteroidota bacterium]
MQQYNSIKSKYPDAILLFRMGDFYETFGQDAIIASSVLGIVLTKRAHGKSAEVELAGFPYHALDMYLPKLVRSGYRVAICEQLEDPKLAKTIVKRGVTELVTPGVALSEKILDHKSNNFLAAVHFEKEEGGIAFVDISTGEFFVATGGYDYLDQLIQSFQPAEIIFSKPKQKLFNRYFGDKHYTYVVDDWIFTYDFTSEILLKHFETNSLKGFGIENLTSGIIAAGAAIHYLNETAHSNLQHISTISRIEKGAHIWMDKFTIRNLELVHSPNENGASLLDVLDSTGSPMGARQLRRWILLPLKDKTQIEERLEVVEYLIKNPALNDGLKQSIKEIGDMERLIAKVPLGKINPRELLQLKRALQAIDNIKKLCIQSKHKQLKKIADRLNPCKSLINRIEKEIKPSPPLVPFKGEIFNDGVSKELDKLRKITFSGKDYMLEIQKTESTKQDIPSLKVGFNHVFGYYLEVTNKHKSKVPADWIRKQTLVSAERYVTIELKEYEEQILNAEEKIIELEQKLFDELVISIYEYIDIIQTGANKVGKLDCLLSFSDTAVKNNYRKPEIKENLIIDIKDGRHPVIEYELGVEEAYIPNDVYLDNEQQQILIITGPNMSGKSALLRQTALIILMAQIGSFVPASNAKIGLVDKIFTRVGATDNISSGESTFMVEMNETASIINNISERSLILLDEIGRGTSTYDGISLAWALADYLHNNENANPKTLFATHYHELNELSNQLPRIKNFNVSIKEVGNKVIFLRKLVEGGSGHSFGIHVAKMAGLPKSIIKKANEILKTLEEDRSSERIKQKIKDNPQLSYQLNLFDIQDKTLIKIKEELANMEVESITPVEALMKLSELVKMLKEEE